MDTKQLLRNAIDFVPMVKLRFYNEKKLQLHANDDPHEKGYAVMFPDGSREWYTEERFKKEWVTLPGNAMPVTYGEYCSAIGILIQDEEKKSVKGYSIYFPDKTKKFLTEEEYKTAEEELKLI